MSYSADTEILTRRGWLTFDQVMLADEVATLSLGGEFQWRTPDRRITEAFDGHMIEFRSKAVNLLVTPSATMLAGRQQGSHRGRWHTCPAWYFAEHPAGRFEIPVTSWWTGTEPPADFEIPGQPSARRRPAHERATEWLAGILTEPWTPAAQVWDAARAAGVKEKPLAGARQNLGVEMRRKGFGPGARWEMSAPTQEHAPVTSSVHVPLRGFTMPMVEFCIFLGLFLAEGWVVSGREDIMVSQSPMSPDLEDIRHVLGATGLRWRYDPPRRKFTTQHKLLSEWLGENTGHRAWNKRVPDGFKDFAPKFLEALLKGMMMGDGEEHHGKGRRYHTTSARLADDVQEMFQKLGVDTWVKRRAPSRASALVPDRGNFHQAYIVFERLRSVHHLPRPAQIEYHGHVYNVAVPNGIIYVRRNGVAAWCGSWIPG